MFDHVRKLCGHVVILCQRKRVALPLASTKIPNEEHTKEGGGFEDGRIAGFFFGSGFAE
jgi:hypothetical protein